MTQKCCTLCGMMMEGACSHPRCPGLRNTKKDKMRNRQIIDFIAANDRSPVIEGSVLDLDAGGALYTLECGTVFKLYADECRRLPEGYPKWKHIPQKEAVMKSEKFLHEMTIGEIREGLKEAFPEHGVVTEIRLDYDASLSGNPSLQVYLRFGRPGHDSGDLLEIDHAERMDDLIESIKLRMSSPVEAEPSPSTNMSP